MKVPRNLREFFLHDELLVASITCQDQRLVTDIIVTVFVEFMLEVILGADGEVDFAFPFLGDLQDAVAPVVSSLSVLGVVDSVVSDNQWILEVGD